MSNCNQEDRRQVECVQDPVNMQLAMAYVQRQRWNKVYNADTALCVGTIFPELEFPFKGKGGCSR